LECSVSFKMEESKNWIAIRPLPVLISSKENILEANSANCVVLESLRVISPMPLSSEISPISAALSDPTSKINSHLHIGLHQ